MRQHVAEVLVLAGEQLGIEVTHHDDYSGRCMYGRTTHAISLDCQSDLPVIAAQCVVSIMDAHDADSAADLITDLVADLKRLQTDCLGRGIIAY